MSTIKSIARPSKSKRLMIALVAAAIIALGGLGIGHVAKLKGHIQYQQIELQHSKVELQSNQAELKEATQTLEKVKVEKQTTEQENQKLEQEKKDLESQLQAKAEAKAALAQVAAAVVDTAPVLPVSVAPAPEPSPSPVVVAGCGDNWMANYIYSHESGCNTNARNPGGCFGLGQDCNNVVSAQCGTDYICQNTFFNNYANTHCDYHTGAEICYHGWDGAYAFWLANSWW